MKPLERWHTRAAASKPEGACSIAMQESQAVHMLERLFPDNADADHACQALKALLSARIKAGLAGNTIYKCFGDEAKKMEQALPGVAHDVATAGHVGQQDRPLTASEYVATFEPRIDGLMHSAPRYDELTKPTRVPLPVSCIKMENKGCKCFTQDATPYKATPEVCGQIVDGGIFLDFLPEQQQTGSQPIPAQAPAATGPRFAVIPSTPTPLAPRSAVTGSGSS